MKNRERTRLRTELSRLAHTLSETPLTLVIAPGGSGKTTLAAEWREVLRASEQPFAWLTVADLHADLALFLEDVIGALRAALPDEANSDAPRFGESIERLLHAKLDIDPAQALRRMTIELRSQMRPPILCLDGYEHLPRASASTSLVDGLLRLDPCPLRLVVTSRGSRPAAATQMLAAGNAIEIDSEALNLRTAQIVHVLEDEGVEPEPDLVAGLLGRTRGWAMAIRLVARSLAALTPEDRLEAVRELGGQRDLFDYIGSELIGRATPDMLEILETSARIGPAPESLLLAAADPSSRPESGLRESLEAGLLLAFGSQLVLHDLWRDWLQSPRRQKLPHPGDAAIRIRIGQAFEALGEHQRAVSQYRAALPSTVAEELLARLLAEHAHDWVNAGLRSLVEPALEALPGDRIQSSPSLMAARGLLLAGRDPERAITHLRTASDSYRESGQFQAEANCLHELGIVAFNENRSDVLREIRSRLFIVARGVGSSSIRGSVLIALGAVAMLARRHRMALRFLDTARTFDHAPREVAGIGIMQSTVLFYLGRWDDIYQRIESILARPEQRQHGSSYFALRVFQTIIDSARGIEPERQTARFEEASEFLAQCHLSHLRIRTDIAFGHHLRRNGERSRAAELFGGAESAARRIELWEAVGAAAGASARLHQLEGDLESARRSALSALQELDRQESWSVQQRGTAHTFYAGIMLACGVLADVGEAQRAWDFLTKHRKRFHVSGLGVCQHLTNLTRSRVAAALGRPSELASSMREAWSAADRSKIEGFAPEIDRDLLVDAVKAARSIGVVGPSLDRAADELGMSRPSELSIRSLGGLEVTLQGRKIPDRAWRGVTSRRLLGRLLLANGQWISRERIETSFWPDATATQARSNFRSALLRLRDALEPRRRHADAKAVLEVDGDLIRLSPEALASWDVSLWRSTLKSARVATDRGHATVAMARLDEVRALDRGELFPELDDEWIVSERNAIEWDRVSFGRALAGLWLERNETDCAIRFARMVLDHNPLDRPSWALLVRAHFQASDVVGARRAIDEARMQFERLQNGTLGPELEALAESL